jgi:hypothetical protein
VHHCPRSSGNISKRKAVTLARIMHTHT